MKLEEDKIQPWQITLNSQKPKVAIQKVSIFTKATHICVTDQTNLCLQIIIFREQDERQLSRK